MHSKRPKDYWKFLNSVKSKTGPDMPHIKTLYEYFKNSNIPDYEVQENCDIENNFNLDNNEYFNSPITSAEIEKCINKLKNSKSPGTDNKINEYIKQTKKLLLPVYTQLFNIILLYQLLG